MRKRITQNDILFLAISFFVVIFAWIGFNVYHAWATTTITEDLQVQIIPISPKFDTQTLDNLKNRKKVTPLFEGALAESPTPTPTASPSASTSATPEAPTQDEEFIQTPSVTTVPSSITPTTSITPTGLPTVTP